MLCPDCNAAMDYRNGCFIHVRGDTYLGCDVAICECGHRQLFGFACETCELPKLAESDPHGLVVGEVVVR